MNKIVNTLKVAQINKSDLRKNVLFHLKKNVAFIDVEESNEILIGCDTFSDILGEESENPLAFSPMLDMADIMELSDLENECVKHDYFMLI